MEKWYKSAICVGRDGFYDFPSNKVEEQKSKSVCKVCPVRLECLAYALFNSEDKGIWGGMNERQRSFMFVIVPNSNSEELILEFLLSYIHD